MIVGRNGGLKTDDHGFLQYDITDPAAPVELWKHGLRNIHSIAGLGDRLAVGTAFRSRFNIVETWQYVFDIASDSPQEIGQLYGGVMPYEAEWDGDILWWLDRSEESERYAPRVKAASFTDEKARSVGEAELSSAARALAVDEGVAAVGLGGAYGAIELFGPTADGRSIERLGGIGDDLELIGAVAAAEGRVVAVPADYSEATLLVFDPQSLDVPRIASRWSSGARGGRQVFGASLGTSRRVALSGSVAWVADAAGVHAVDIADVSAPTHLLTLDVPATDIAIDGDRLIVLEERALTVYAITGPVSPGTLTAEGRVAFVDHGSGALAVAGDIAYTLMDGGQVLGWDIADPASIRAVIGLAPQRATNPDHGDLIAMGDWLAVVRDTVEIFERRGSFLDSLGSPPAPAGAVASRAAWDGRNLIVAGGAAGIYAIDGDEAGRSALIGLHDTPGTAHDIAIHGNRIYVADGDGGLRVIRYRESSYGPLPFRIGLPWAGVVK